MGSRTVGTRTAGRRTVQALVVVGLLSGCASTAPPPSPPPSPSAVPSPSSAPAPGPSPGATPSPAPPLAAPPAAADGTDVAACGDGRCQIEVRAGTVIPLSPELGARNLTILRVTGDRVTYGASRGNNLAGTTGSVGSTNTVQRLTVTVDAVSGDTAVLTLRPA